MEVTGDAELEKVGLKRELTMLGFISTICCTVIGGGINVLTCMIQVKAPGVGPYVPLAFLIGAVPSLVAGIVAGALSAAVPRAGGHYTYVSRLFDPFLAFFSSWSRFVGEIGAFVAIAIGDVALLAAMCKFWGAPGAGNWLNAHTLEVATAIIIFTWLVNVLGIRIYEAVVDVMFFILLTGFFIVVGYGFTHSLAEYLKAIGGTTALKSLISQAGGLPKDTLSAIFSAAATLVFAYVGFETGTQAAGEVKKPEKTVFRGMLIALGIITAYYLLYSAAVYHAVPWEYIYAKAALADKAGSNFTVPEAMAPIMPSALAGYVAFVAAIALLSDLPPMFLSTSRMTFAWAYDGMFPKALAKVHKRFGTPHWALTVLMIISVILTWAVGEFLVAVDITTVALLFTYLFICMTGLVWKFVRPDIYEKAPLGDKTKKAVNWLGAIGTVLSLLFLGEIAISDSTSFYWWIALMVPGPFIFYYAYNRTVKKLGPEKARERLMTIPPE